MVPLLFQPLTLRGITVKNRIVVAPMMTYCAPLGRAGDWHLMHYGQFAAGGAGLVMVESTKIERRGCSTTHDLGIWSDAFVEHLEPVAKIIKSYGAVAGIQLGHAGRKARTSLPWEGFEPLRADPGVENWASWELIAPSAMAHSKAHGMPREMTLKDIQDVIEAWGNAAARANRAGFDVIEIHGAHGYLIHEFLSPDSNRRSDKYGGSLSNRMRFALEVAQNVRRCWPADKPLFFRLSATDGEGWSVNDSVELSRGLKQQGVDIIDCSSGGMEYRAVQATRNAYHYGYQVPYAEQIRREADIGTAAVGLIIHADQAEEILHSGAADLIAIGREFLHNPHWPLDAAQKLHFEGGLDQVPLSYGFWLGKRTLSGFGGCPSTWQRGMRDQPTASSLEGVRTDR